jgi:hypothetical protein
MIIDGLLQFDPALSAITVTRVSTNVLDLLNARDIGTGSPPMYLYVGINAAFTAAGAGTLTIQLQGSADNVDANYKTYAESRAFSIADLTPVGRVLVMAWPNTMAADVLPRYLRLNYVVATGPFTAGSLNAELVLDAQSTRLYPAGINITN